MIQNKFLHYKTLEAFNTDLNSGNIKPDSICFIANALTIYTHGKYYRCLGSDEEDPTDPVEPTEEVSNTHNILPFDGFEIIPTEKIDNNLIYPIQIVNPDLNYKIVAGWSLLSQETFYAKAGDKYYTKWQVYGVDPSIHPGGGSYTQEPISDSDWYNTEDRKNKIFYDRSSDVLYAYNYDSKTLLPITPIQIAETDTNDNIIYPSNPTKGSTVIVPDLNKMVVFDGQSWNDIANNSAPDTIAFRNGTLYLEKSVDGGENTIISQVAIPTGGGQTVLVQSNEDSPSIVRLNANTSKLGKKVIPLGTSVENLFKNGIRQDDTDVYNQSTYDSDGGAKTVYHIKYEFDLNGDTVVVPTNSILKFEGGCLKNGILRGDNTVIEVDGTYAIFDNMSFRGTFRDSNLYATNFGAVGDMHSVSDSLTYKNLVELPIMARTGFDNTPAFNSLRRFLYDSENITINFNGDFYMAPVTSQVTDVTTGDTITVSNSSFNELRIYRANNLTFRGGTTIAGWYFLDCNNVTIDGCNFVGLHEKHDFPYIITSPYTHTYEVINSNNEKVTESHDYGDSYGEVVGNAYMVFRKADSSVDFGIAQGIYFTSDGYYNPKPKAEQVSQYEEGETTIFESQFPKGLIVKNCHFEMRSTGVYLGSTGKIAHKYKMVTDCVVENCTFEHISTQPLSLHARNCTFRNLTMDYVGMPFDLSSGSAYCTFDNIRVEGCGQGWKQEHCTGLDNLEGVPFFCGGNVIKNLYVNMDSRFPRLHAYLTTSNSVSIDGLSHTYKYTADSDYYSLKINQGTAGDVLQLENCTFKCTRAELNSDQNIDGSFVMKDKFGNDFVAPEHSDVYKVGRKQIYTIIQNYSPAYFKNCKFEVSNANLFTRNGTNSLSSTRVHTFDKCDIDITGKIEETIFYNANINLFNCKFKYAGVDAPGIKGKSGIGSVFYSQNVVFNIKQSDIEIEYGTDIELPNGSEFVGNNLVFKNISDCIYIPEDNVKIDGNTITCTGGNSSDNDLKGKSIFYFNNSAVSENIRINNNNIDSKFGYLMFFNNGSVSNFEFKYNRVNLNNSVNNNYTLIRDGANSGKLFKADSNNKIYKNIFTGVSPQLIVRNTFVNIGDTETPVYANPQSIINEIFKDNIIGSSYKNNVEYPKQSISNLSGYTYIKSNAISNDTSGKQLGQDERGLTFYNTYNNKVYVWTGSGWQIQNLGSGAFANKPLADKVEVGTTYFDTTNGKLIVSNGTDWVNVDGTPLTNS